MDAESHAAAAEAAVSVAAAEPVDESELAPEDRHLLRIVRAWFDTHAHFAPLVCVPQSDGVLVYTAQNPLHYPARADRGTAAAGDNDDDVFGTRRYLVTAAAEGADARRGETGGRGSGWTVRARTRWNRLFPCWSSSVEHTLVVRVDGLEVDDADGCVVGAGCAEWQYCVTTFLGDQGDGAGGRDEEQRVVRRREYQQLTHRFVHPSPRVVHQQQWHARRYRRHRRWRRWRRRLRAAFCCCTRIRGGDGDGNNVENDDVDDEDDDEFECFSTVRRSAPNDWLRDGVPAICGWLHRGWWVVDVPRSRAAETTRRM